MRGPFGDRVLFVSSVFTIKGENGVFDMLISHQSWWSIWCRDRLCKMALGRHTNMRLLGFTARRPMRLYFIHRPTSFSCTWQAHSAVLCWWSPWWRQVVNFHKRAANWFLDSRLGSMGFQWRVQTLVNIIRLAIVRVIYTSNNSGP